MADAGSQGAPGGARRGDRELGAQARVAWDRVQTVLQRRSAPKAVASGVLEAVDLIPAEAFLAGIAGSFVASLLLEASNRRRAAALTGIWLPLGLGVALYAKIARQSSSAT